MTTADCQVLGKLITLVLQALRGTLLQLKELRSVRPCHPFFGVIMAHLELGNYLKCSSHMTPDVVVKDAYLGLPCQTIIRVVKDKSRTFEHLQNYCQLFQRLTNIRLGCSDYE